MKQALRSTIDSSFVPEDCHLLRTNRKLSLFSDQLQWQESESHPLARLGNYITNNIQSQRKSIIQLYSTSFCLLQKHNNSIFPQLASPDARKISKRKIAKQAVDVVTGRGSSPMELNNDPDFIVSNNFPNKLMKKQKNKLDMIVKEPAQPIKIKKQKDKELFPSKKSVKIVRTSPQGGGVHFSKLAIRKKLPKLHITKSKEQDRQASQLNPWEYLQIQDEPIFISNSE